MEAKTKAVFFSGNCYSNVVSILIVSESLENFLYFLQYTIFRLKPYLSVEMWAQLEKYKNDNFFTNYSLNQMGENGMQYIQHIR